MYRLLLAVLISIAPTYGHSQSLLAQGAVQYVTQVSVGTPFDEAQVGTGVAGFTLRLASNEGSILATLFDGLQLDAGDVGRTFAVATGDPGFSAFVALLTDGTPHRFLREFWLGGFGAGAGGGGVVNDTERDAFERLGPPGTGPDLAGLAIERIEFQVESLAIDWSGATSVSMSFATVYSVYGQPVPEASTGFLMLSGLLALGVLRRNRQRRAE